ncbi:Zinc knuckle CX2CX4HX4C [Corchorus olitorius]|uniref:Zinc knuckle CX2CX4HX4C n=1 Tax=Corchorus olitorius TaxID=93759 RepID=A0A1R3HFY8_9ROSI|nr:Zinc knuckle CX2CX4HX4C [Corchorus olitorius]
MANAEKVGKVLGKILEIESLQWKQAIGRGFLRIRVAMKVGEPLLGGFWVPRQNGGRIWAEIRYEKLGDFCYTCGKLGHGEKSCAVGLREQFVEDDVHPKPHLEKGVPEVSQAEFNAFMERKKWGKENKDYQEPQVERVVPKLSPAKYKHFWRGSRNGTRSRKTLFQNMVIVDTIEKIQRLPISCEGGVENSYPEWPIHSQDRVPSAETGC